MNLFGSIPGQRAASRWRDSAGVMLPLPDTAVLGCSGLGECAAFSEENGRESGLVQRTWLLGDDRDGWSATLHVDDIRQPSA